MSTRPSQTVLERAATPAREWVCEGLNHLRAQQAASDLPVRHFCVESPLQKYFASPVGQIISTDSRHPTPPQGRIAIVTDAGWDAVDAAAFCARWDRRAGSSGLVSDHRCADERRFSRTA